MSIQYVILGLLSWRPLSGYDLKKHFSDSMALYWSGNNNQIYRTLVALHKEGLVDVELQTQEETRLRKLYHISDAGLEELKHWVLTTPELPQIKHTFLMQLAWADQLSSGELTALLDEYEDQVATQLTLCRVQAQQQDKHELYLNTKLARTPREAFLWEMIQTNWIDYYTQELAWVKKLRKGLEKKDEQNN